MVASLALGQSYYVPSISEVTINDIDKINGCHTATKHNKFWTTCLPFWILSCYLWCYYYNDWLTMPVSFVWSPGLSNPVMQHHILHSPLGKFADCVPCSVGIRQFVGDARGIHISGTVSSTGIDHPPGHGSPTSIFIMVITILWYKHHDHQRWICELLEIMYIYWYYHIS